MPLVLKAEDTQLYECSSTCYSGAHYCYVPMLCSILMHWISSMKPEISCCRMNSLISRKKHYKFLVTLEIEELRSIPFFSGVLFAKIRLLGGGHFEKFSPGKEVQNYKVAWNYSMQFPVKMTANCKTGMLHSCLCRISVRKETRGGKDNEKLGFVDADLAEVPGNDIVIRRYILEGYGSKQRLNNATLQIKMSLKLLSGYPLFKSLTPSLSISPEPTLSETETVDKENVGGMSLHCSIDETDSVDRKEDTDLLASCEADSFDALSNGHFVPPNTVGRPNVLSVSCSANLRGLRLSRGHSPKKPFTSPIDDQGLLENIQQEYYPWHIEPKTNLQRFLKSSRPDVDNVVQDILESCQRLADESADTSGLQLFVGNDGSTGFSKTSYSEGSQLPAHMKPVRLDSVISIKSNSSSFSSISVPCS